MAKQRGEPYLAMHVGLERPPRLGREARAEGASWYLPPIRTVAVRCVDWPDYIIEVEVSFDAVDAPVATGVSVRRALPTKATTRPWTDVAWPKGTQPLPVSTRDIRRLPLERIVNAALVMLIQLTKEPADDRMDAMAELLNPATRPTRRNKATFYEAVGQLARRWIADGKSPAKELARAKNVDTNTAHQWLHKARKLGFLEPSPRSRRHASD
jgi:hypothetical protein